MLLQSLMEVGLGGRHNLALKVLLELLRDGLDVLRLARLVVEHLEDLLVHDALHASHGVSGDVAADVCPLLFPACFRHCFVCKVLSFTVPCMHHTLCWGAGLLNYVICCSLRASEILCLPCLVMVPPGKAVCSDDPANRTPPAYPV